MFEGLFSPSHLLILAFVLFMVIGPRKIAGRWHRAGESLRRLTDDETPSAPEPQLEHPSVPQSGSQTQSVPQQREPPRSAAYRIGRLIRGRHR